MYESLYYEPTEQDYADWMLCLEERDGEEASSNAGCVHVSSVVTPDGNGAYCASCGETLFLRVILTRR